MIVVIQCRDQVGLVAAVSGVLAGEGLNIVSLREHVDKAENRFFIRIEAEQDRPAGPLERQLQQVLPAGALITVNPIPEKRIAVLVTEVWNFSVRRMMPASPRPARSASRRKGASGMSSRPAKKSASCSTRFRDLYSHCDGCGWLLPAARAFRCSSM